VVVEPYEGDPRKVWERIATLEGIVAMRLHAGIFAYCSQTPTLLVPYEEKSHAWAAMVGHPPELVRSLETVTGDDLEWLVTEAPMPTLPIGEARAAASRNFEAIGA
jgi:polysaccharide pyruvyl transferase WcaK-like protein